MILNKMDNLTDIQKKVYSKGLFVLSVFFLTIVLVVSATAAWYSNVVQVSELTYEVDSWGVDASITIEDNSFIKAAPGDIGTIPYKIINEADDMVNVQVSTVKKSLPDFLQKRIYFYIDDSVEVNNEVIEKLYLHDNNYYSYIILGEQIVDNNQFISTNPEIKWKWVYDLLGYYVIIDTDAENISKEISYLRPVEYIYEDAVYDSISAELSEITVGEEIYTRDMFVKKLLDTDGFVTKEFTNSDELKTTLKFKDEEGNVEERSYYEVYKSDSYNVYLYLFDRNEIANNNRIDTAIGNFEEDYLIPQDNCTQIIISCNQAAEYFIDISDSTALYSVLTDKEAYNELLAANNLLDKKDNVIFRITSDMNINNVVLHECSDIIVDLNGYTITCSGPFEAGQEPTAFFAVNAGSSLKLYNGTVNPGNYTPFECKNSTLVVKDLVFTHTTTTVVSDNRYQPKGSNIQLIDCTWPEGIDSSVATIQDINNEGENIQSYRYIKTAESEELIDVVEEVEKETDETQ